MTTKAAKTIRSHDAVSVFAALAHSFKDLKPNFSKCGAAASASLCDVVTQMFQTLRDVKQLAAEVAATTGSDVTEVKAQEMLAQLKRAKAYVFSGTVKHNYLAMLRKTFCTEGRTPRWRSTLRLSARARSS